MKLFSTTSGKRWIAGASLAEMIIASGIFSLIVICMVSSQLFALRTYSIAKSKMISTGGARKAEDLLRDNIRSASSVFIGNFKTFTNMNLSGSAFPTVTNGAEQGNSIEIFPTTNATPYYICYLNPHAQQLFLYDSSRTNTQVLADNIINTNIFASEDYHGKVLTVNSGNSTIRMNLLFYQDVYAAKGGNVQDYYNFTMRATIR